MTGAALRHLFSLPRPYKRALQLMADAVLIVSSFALAMLLRTESFGFVVDLRAWVVLGGALPLTLLMFIKLGFYRAVIRYMGLRALLTILIGVLSSAILISILSLWLHLPIPVSVPVIYALLAFCTVGGIRFGFRAIYQRSHSRDKTRVIIYGAGQAGRQTAHSLGAGVDYAAVAFVDDNPELWGSQIHGLRVFAPAALEGLLRDYGAAVLLLAIPSATRGTRANILRRLERLPIRVQTIPGMAEIISGKHKLVDFTEVPIEDLLGRDPVPADPKLMAANIGGRVVMVTGAGGSIGGELCRQILRQGPVRLVLLEHSEFALYEIAQELSRDAVAEGLAVDIVQVLGSVCDAARLEAVMRAHGVQTVYHAAAYKHVPIVEENPIEGVMNNVFGTLSCARAALAVGVESFTLVSTDKAVRPTNVMGASKRMAELVCQALSQGESRTRFSMVRFGNVLGSSGSVIPLFRRQIAEGGPVTVTHTEIMRYFMTIPEAAQLVIQASGLAQGGDVFLLDMGEPVRIRDLAERMVRLSGFIPVIEGETPNTRRLSADAMRIVFTAPRRGEKLVEEMFVGTFSEPTCHSRILTATETSLDWSRLAPMLDQLQFACRSGDEAELRQILMDAPLGFAPRRAARVVAGQKAVAATGTAAGDKTTPLVAPVGGR